MKPSTFKPLIFVLSLVASFSVIFFGLPYLTLVLLVPALIYTQLLLSNNYSFRDSLALESIPETGYEKRIGWLNNNQNLISKLGFAKFDEFYLQTASDALAFAYVHDLMPIVSCDYDLGQIKIFDFDTKFQNGYLLTTTNSRGVHIVEQQETKLLQTFPEASYEELFHKHIQSIEFLRSQGLQPQEFSPTLFRSDFLQEFLETGKKLKGFLSPIKILYKLTFGNKYKFNKTIQEQFLSRSLALPSEF